MRRPCLEHRIVPAAVDGARRGRLRRSYAASRGDGRRAARSTAKRRRGSVPDAGGPLPAAHAAPGSVRWSRARPWPKRRSRTHGWGWSVASSKFEGRSSFKTWLFRILVNRTRSAGAGSPPSLHRGRASGRPEPVRRPGSVGGSRRALDGGVRGPSRRRHLGSRPQIRTRRTASPPAPGRHVARCRRPARAHEACTSSGSVSATRGSCCTEDAPDCARSSTPRWGRAEPCCRCDERTSCVSRRSNSSPTTWRARSPGRDRRRFEAHLEACPNCAAYLEQIRVTMRCRADRTRGPDP